MSTEATSQGESARFERAQGSTSSRRQEFVRRWLVPLLALCATALAVQATRSAVAWYGRPLGGLLVDSDGVVSSVGLSSWDGARHGLHFPDRVVGVDDVSIEPAFAGKRGVLWDEAVLLAARKGHESVRARVVRQGSSQVVELHVVRLAGLAWWAFGGALFFAGTLYVVAALIALWVSPSGSLAGAFARLALAAGVFLITLFDFHTSKTLVPFFLVAFATLPFCFVGLALRLPTDLAVLSRHAWLVGALDAAGIVGGAAMVSTHEIGKPTTELQAAWSIVFGACLVTFIATLVTRFARARGTHRKLLKALLLSMVPPYGLVAGFLLLSTRGVWRSEIDVVSFPALALAPLSSVYAFVRHDLWGSRALLSRVVTLLFLGAIACAVATALAAAIATGLGVPFHGALLTAALAAMAGGVFVAGTLAFGEKLVFPARAGYKPTIEQLSRDLTNLTSPSEVANAVQRTVARWLPCDRIELQSIDGDAVAKVASESPASLERDRAGVVLPLAFEGRPLAMLVVGEKRGGTLFTADDVDLLRTIANQGGLAMAHALAYQELEQRRRDQASAWQGERAALVETMASEVAHEVRYPINFFRSLFERGAKHGKLSDEDVDIGREEVERLERLVSGLRRVAMHALDRKPTKVSELCSRVELLLRDTLGERSLKKTVDDELLVSCDRDQATQILVNLVSNALEATGPSGEVGITCRRTGDGAELGVWDTGSGFSGDPMQLFAPWFTTKARGTGLGLSITLRLARAHGWNVVPKREAGRTIFTVEIPSRDIAGLTPSEDEETEVA